MESFRVRFSPITCSIRRTVGDSRPQEIKLESNLSYQYIADSAAGRMVRSSKGKFSSRLADQMKQYQIVRLTPSIMTAAAKVLRESYIVTIL